MMFSTTPGCVIEAFAPPNQGVTSLTQKYSLFFCQLSIPSSPLIRYRYL
uniref:Uncharacterized protein n=1 Tax=Lepeophtheirus salmonis TaxID=72036 RepID=A0A0K2TX15_LEPSM